MGSAEAAEYAVLLALAAVGGLGIPGLGDAALIGAALAAADGHLSIAVVLLVAFGGHEIGRWIAYQLGARRGRPFMERPGWAVPPILRRVAARDARPGCQRCASRASDAIVSPAVFGIAHV